MVMEKGKGKREMRHPRKGEQEEHFKMAETFLTKSCGSTDFPDLCFQSQNENLKLRGGSRIKIFNTDEEEIDRVLSIFRSL